MSIVKIWLINEVKWSCVQYFAEDTCILYEDKYIEKIEKILSKESPIE